MCFASAAATKSSTSLLTIDGSSTLTEMAGPWEDLEAGTRHRVCQDLAGLHAWAIALANHDERRSWKVELGVRVTDLTRRGEDDRARAVYFVFGETGDATKGPMALLSTSTTRALVYVFGGNGPRFSLVPSPRMGNRGKFFILRPADGPKRQWLQESVDLKADYVRGFGQAPGLLLAVVVSSDSDDTRGRNRAQLRGLRIDR
jgi:hypothetical protein